MGKRREARKQIKLPVRIFGTDRDGKIFSEKVFTIDVSRTGAQLAGIQAQMKNGEIIGLTYGTTKIHFRVAWVGEPGTPKAGLVGLLNLSPEKPLWDFPLPSPGVDSVRVANDRRRTARVRSVNSAEVYPNGQEAPIRVRTADISLGGCFVEMPNAMPKGTPVRIAVWIKETKLWANGRVVSCAPGFGSGVQFTEISAQDRELLKQFLDSLARVPI